MIYPNTLRVQDQVKDVTNVMRENVNKLLDRGDRLEDLQVIELNYAFTYILPRTALKA